MDKLLTALAPAFAVGLGMQKLLELLDPVVDAILGAIEASDADRVRLKKLTAGALSLTAGIILSAVAELGVLSALRATSLKGPQWVVDVIVTGLIVSGGTEGMNSIVKFLGYAKDAKKADVPPASTGVPAAGLPPPRSFPPNAPPPSLKPAAG